MITFKELFEAKDALGHGSEKHHVMAFARMNPPTTGHMEVISKLHAVAKEHNAPHSLIVSGSHDAKKNPLTPEQKVKHLKRYSPETNVHAASKESPTILHHAAALHKQGVQHLHVVAGSDRHKEMHELLHKYNTGEEHKHGSFKFKSITMHSSGERDPDSEGTSGMSGTKMRQHAHENNFKEFRKGVPSHVSDKHAHELMNDVRKGSGIKEEAISYKTFMEARMSAAVKLQRAFEREQAKSAASRQRAQELLNPKKEEPKPQKTNEHIEKVAGGYEVESEHGNKNLGKSKTLAGAKKRLAQVEYFKHMKEEEMQFTESVHDNRTGFSRRKREDDEYHNGGDLKRHTYKYNVSKPGVNDGKKHERHVTTPLTTRHKSELEHLARAHLTKQGYQIHEEEQRGPYKQKSPVVIAPKDPKAKTYGKIVSKLRPMAEESDAYARSEENKKSADSAKAQGDMFAHHLHMADHHDNLAQWHSEKGRHGEADRHATKAEEHHEKAMSLKEDRQIDESMTASWRAVQSMDKGSITGGKDAVKKRLAYLHAVHAHHKKFGNDTKKVKSDIERINRARLAEEQETQETEMGLKSFTTLVKEGTLQSSGDDSIPTLTSTPAKEKKKAEEAIDEGVDPSEIAGNPRMYSADSAKKAYYHKRATASEKETLAKHLDRHHGNSNWRKPVKEEAEQIDETYAKVETHKYSWGTMKTAHHGHDFSVPMHPEHHKAIHALKDNQEHKFKDETGRHWTAKRQGDDVHLHSANDGPKTKIKHSDLKEEVEQIEEKAPPGFEGTVKAMKKHPEIDNPYALSWYMKNKGDKSHRKADGTVKEEAEQIDERNKENATKRKMMDASRGARYKTAGNPVPERGEEHKTAQAHNKAIGRALRNEESELEEAKHVAPTNKKPAIDIDKVNAAGQEPHEEKFEDAKKAVRKEGFSVSDLFQALKEGMWPGTPEYKAKYDGAKQGGGSGIKKGTRYGGSLQKDDHDEDDAPKAGRPAGAKSGARKNLGNSKLHK